MRVCGCSGRRLLSHIRTEQLALVLPESWGIETLSNDQRPVTAVPSLETSLGVRRLRQLPALKFMFIFTHLLSDNKC
jgi:hypothetical protein